MITLLEPHYKLLHLTSVQRAPRAQQTQRHSGLLWGANTSSNTSNVSHNWQEVLISWACETSRMASGEQSWGSRPTEIPESLKKYANVFDPASANKLPDLRGGDHDMKINLTPDADIKPSPLYNMSENELKVLKEYLNDNLKKRFIRPFKSSIASPVLFANKKGEGMRFCVDYHKLNWATIKNRYTILLISEMLECFRNVKYFTRLNIKHAYHLLWMTENHEHKTAFKTRYENYEYLVVPFGLCNAPAQFQQFIQKVLLSYLDNFVIVYIDDVVIYTKNNDPETHWQHVWQVLQKFRKKGLYCSLSKSRFLQCQVDFVGYTLTPNEVQMNPARIQAILNWPTPHFKSKIREFLRFCNFYRRFVKCYSWVAWPLTDMMKKNRIFEWNDELQRSFDKLKKAFTKALLLTYFDRNKQIYIFTDASGYAISGIIMQRGESGHLHSVTFYSHKMLNTEHNYSTHDAEMLAIIELTKHWSHWLHSALHKVIINIDHNNLKPFLFTKILFRRQARWLQHLSTFNVEIKHRPGWKNPTDGPSRQPNYKLKLKKLMELNNTLRRFLIQGATWIQQEQNITLAFIQQQEVPLSDILNEQTTAHQRPPSIIDRVQEIMSDHPKKLILLTDNNKFWSIDKGLLFYKERLYVSEDESLCFYILQQFHDSPAEGHMGIRKTQDIISKWFYWSTMRSDILQYCQLCEACKWMKTSTR